MVEKSIEHRLILGEYHNFWSFIQMTGGYIAGFLNDGYSMIPIRIKKQRRRRSSWKSKKQCRRRRDFFFIVPNGKIYETMVVPLGWHKAYEGWWMIIKPFQLYHHFPCDCPKVVFVTQTYLPWFRSIFLASRKSGVFGMTETTLGSSFFYQAKEVQLQQQLVV